MELNLKGYLDSFRDKYIVLSTVVDVVFFAVMGPILYLFKLFTDSKTQEFLGGRTQQQLQDVIVNNPEQGQIIAQQLQSFMINFGLGVILIVLLSLFLFSLTRGYLWNKLLNKNFTKKKYWRWNSLNLALILPTLIYLVFVFIVRIIYLQTYSAINNQAAFSFISEIISLVLIVIYLIFLFLIYYSFTFRYKVWQSIGEGFKLVKTRWNTIWRSFIFMLITLVILTVITSLLTRLFPFQETLLIYVDSVLLILFVAWMRVYLLRRIHS